MSGHVSVVPVNSEAGTPPAPAQNVESELERQQRHKLETFEMHQRHRREIWELQKRHNLENMSL
jgi:hypothetical protein